MPAGTGGELPPVNSQKDWEELLELVRAGAKIFADLVEKMPDEALLENMTDQNYGSFFRNLTGTAEHFHYHLGQIVLIK